MKFQDDISMPHTYTHTHTHMDKPKPICSPLFQSFGHNKELGHAHFAFSIVLHAFSLLFNSLSFG